VARRKKKASAPPGAPAWMLTYGDLVTQMLTFFILLFTFSTLDTVKFRDAVISLQGAFGVLSGGTQLLNLSDMPTSIPTLEQTNPMTISRMVEVKNLLDKAIEEIDKKGSPDQQNKGKQDQTETQQNTVQLVQTIIDEKGLRIRFTDPVLFDLGKSDLKPEAVAILRAVGDILSTIPNRIQIEGHTDNIPIATSVFRSNWELSSARALSVVHFMVNEGGLRPENLCAVGFGEFQPIFPNDSAENRCRNRRVEMLILSDEEEVIHPLEK
jgi:chemotaxis protein MotB